MLATVFGRGVRAALLVTCIVLFLWPGRVSAQSSITVTPDSIDFGDVDVRFSKEMTLTIANNGTDTLFATTSLTQGVHFVINQGEGELNILPGQQVAVVVAFAPIRAGTTSDSLRIDHSALNEASPLFVDLIGTGHPRPEVAVTPLFRDFGTVAIGFPDTAAIFITNPGSGFLSTKTSIAGGSSDFRLVTTSDVVAVFAGDTARALIEFSPSVEGPAIAVLRVDHNGRNTSEPILVQLSAVGEKSVSLDPTEVNDTPENAFSVVPGFVSAGTEIFPPGDIDYFVYDGVWGEDLVILTENVGDSELDGKLMLIDASGALVAENDNDGSTDRSRIELSLMATGTYFIRMAYSGNDQGLQTSGNPTSKTTGDQPFGAYRLSISRTGLSELAVPSLLSPPEGAPDQRVNSTLIWTSVAGASTYDVVVSTSVNFDAGSIVYQSARPDSFVVVSGLAPGTTFFWRVRAVNPLSATRFTQSRSFATTQPPAVVSPIGVVRIESGSTLIDLRPVFQDPEGGNLTYQVADVADSTVAQVVLLGAQIAVSAVGDGTTEVTVRATDPKDASTEHVFLVRAGAEATAIEGSEAPPSKFALHANYPNPVTETTVIPFDLSEPSEVRVTVFDETGKTVGLLMDRHLASGRHEVRFDRSSLASGVYIVRVEAEGKSASRRMVVTN